MLKKYHFRIQGRWILMLVAITLAILVLVSIILMYRFQNTIEDRLNPHLAKIDTLFHLALWVSLLTFTLVGIAVFLGVRAENRYEHELRESRRLLYAILDNAPSLMYVFDANGRVCLANQLYASLFRTDIKNILHTTRKEFMHPSLAIRADDQDAQVLRSGVPLSFEEHIRSGDMEWTFLTTKFPLIDQEGERWAICGISTDISSQKGLELELRSALEERDLLLKELHHRTRNSMQVIASWLSLQASHSANIEISGMLREAEGRIETMTLIYNTLQEGGDLSRIALAPYIKDLVQQLCIILPEQSRQIETEFQLESVMVLIDHALPIGLILAEFVSCSLKRASGSNIPHIHISLERLENNRLLLRYLDRGGIGEVCEDTDYSSEMGMEVVQALVVGQLHGKLESEYIEGVSYTVEFDDAGYKARI